MTNATATSPKMTTWKKATIVLLAGIVTATAATYAFADKRGGDRGDRAERMEQRFERLDTDSSGGVTFVEFSAPMLDRFNQADANDDGFVTAAEIEQALDGRRAERMADRMVQRFDIDGDEQVSADELQRMQEKVFALADRDDSGEVTAEELPRRFAGGFGHGRGGGDRDRN